MWTFFEWTNKVVSNRAFGVTDTGHFIVGPSGAKPGDLVCIFLGGSLCFVLRETGKHFELIGDAYVSDVMAGELVDGKRDEDLATETFSLV